MQSLIILGVAVFLGLLAVLTANSFLGSGAPSAQASAPAMKKIVVARVPLKFGDTLGPEKLVLVDWPANALPPGAATSFARLLSGGPRVALYPIEPHEPVLLSKLSGEGGRGGLAALIPAGKRAATIRIDDVAGVGGFARPGDTVDVMVTRKVSDDRQITDILLQNIRIVALDQTPEQAEGEKPAVSRTATLEVTQVQAQKLALGQQVGTLSLMLRNVTNQTAELNRTVSLEDLRDGGSAERPRFQPAMLARPAPRAARPASQPQAPRQAPLGVEIVRGVTSSAYHVGIYGGI